MTIRPTIADIDLDGRPDILIAGTNWLYAFDDQLLFKTNYPKQIDDGQPDANAITRITVADIRDGGPPEMIVINEVGNVYAYGDELSYGFPLNSGEQMAPYSNSAAVVLYDSTGGKFGYLGGDGWFYAWDTDKDTTSNFWPMATGSPDGSSEFDQSKLGPLVLADAGLPSERFYNYPNPVMNGQTTIRYYLGENANSVSLNIYSLNGTVVASFDGSTFGGVDNEQVWDCSDVTPGVYRCIIEADMGSSIETAFTDIAIIR
jgi:hypothetical protein